MGERVMNYELPLLQKLIGHFKKLPGVGEKTAQRLTFAVLAMKGGEVADFAETLQQVKEKVGFCNRCGNLSEEETCRICNDGSRVEGVLCIVERPSDIYILERSGQYRGRYHVLHGVLSPLDGIGPGELNLSGLKKRVEEEEIKELIIATNPSIEGDTTSLFILKMFEGKGVRITRLARGIPLGSTLEFVDKGTISKALEGREPL